MSATKTRANGASATKAEDPPKHKTLAEAFAAAQADFPKVEPDATNPHFRSKFVTLGHLLAKVRPILNRHGLAVIQLPARGEDGKPTLRTTILHTSGERIEADALLLLPKQDPQGMGSALTYMKRYALAGALGISDQEDDDGNAATPPALTAEGAQALAEEAVAATRAERINADRVASIIDRLKNLYPDGKGAGAIFGAAGLNAPTKPISQAIPEFTDAEARKLEAEIAVEEAKAEGLEEVEGDE